MSCEDNNYADMTFAVKICENVTFAEINFAYETRADIIVQM